MHLTNVKIRGKSNRSKQKRARDKTSDIRASTKRPREGDENQDPQDSSPSPKRTRNKRSRMQDKVGPTKSSRGSLLERLPAELLEIIFSNSHTVYRCELAREELERAELERELKEIAKMDEESQDGRVTDEDSENDVESDSESDSENETEDLPGMGTINFSASEAGSLAGSDIGSPMGSMDAIDESFGSTHDIFNFGNILRPESSVSGTSSRDFCIRHYHPDLVLPSARLARASPFLGLKLSHHSVISKFAEKLFAAYYKLTYHDCLPREFPFLTYTIGHEISKLLASPSFTTAVLEDLYRRTPEGIEIFEKIQKVDRSPIAAKLSAKHCPFCGCYWSNTIVPFDQSPGGVLRWCALCGIKRHTIERELSFPPKTVLPLKRLLENGFDVLSLKLLIYLIYTPEPKLPPETELPTVEEGLLDGNYALINNVIVFGNPHPFVDPERNIEISVDSLEDVFPPFQSPFLGKEVGPAILKAISDGDRALCSLLLRHFRPDKAMGNRFVDEAVRKNDDEMLHMVMEMVALHEYYPESYLEE